MQLVNGRLLPHKNHHYNEQIFNKNMAKTHVNGPTIHVHPHEIHVESKIHESQVNFETCSDVKVQQITNKSLQNQSFFNSDELKVTSIPLKKNSLMSPLVKSSKNISKSKDCNIGIPIKLDSEVKSNVNNNISESNVQSVYSKKHSWINCKNKSNSCTNYTDINKKLSYLLTENGGSLTVNKLPHSSNKLKEFQNCFPIKDGSNPVTIITKSKVDSYTRQKNFNKKTCINKTMNKYGNKSKEHLINRKLTANSVTVPRRLMSEGPIMVKQLPTLDKLNKFDICLPIKDKSNLAVLKMDTDKSNIIGDYSRQNNFNKGYSNKGSMTRPIIDESKTRLSNKKSTENSKTICMGQTTEDELLDYSITETNEPKEQASSNFKPKMVVNKPFEIDSFSKINLKVNQISSVKCNAKHDDGTRYKCISRNQHYNNNKQNCFKKRISTLQTECGCLRIEDWPDSSEKLKNIKNCFKFKHENIHKKQDNIKKDCYNKNNVLPQLGINSSNIVVNAISFLEKNKSNKIQNNITEQVSMTQKAANRTFNSFSKFNRNEKETPAMGGYIMNPKSSKIINSEIQTKCPTVKDISYLNINSTCIQNNAPKDNKYTTLKQNCNIQNSPIIVIDDSSDSNENSNNIEKGLQIKHKSINVPIERKCNVKQSFCDKNNSVLQLPITGFSRQNKVNEELVNFQKIPLISQKNVSEKWYDDTQLNKSNKEVAMLKKNKYNKFVMNKKNSKLAEKLTKIERNIPSGQHSILQKILYESKTKKCIVSNPVPRIKPNNLIEVHGVTKSDEIPTNIQKDIQIKDDGVSKNQKTIVPKRCVKRIQFSQKFSRKSISRPTFKTKYTFNKNMSKKNIRSKCHLCGRLINYNNWMLHLQGIHHNLYQYYCNLCGKNQANYRLSVNHAELHFLNECYPCEHCNKQFYNGMMLVEHMRKEHKVFVPFQCQKCDELFEKKKCLQRHNLFDACNLISQPKCIECNIIFQQKKNLSKHQEKMHEKPQIKYYCDHCDVHFKFKESIKIHLRAQHGENALKYKKNNNVSIVEKTFLKHHMNEHVENTIKYVDQSIKSFSNLNDFPNRLDRFIETTNRDIDVAIEYDDNLIERLNTPHEYVFNRNNCIENPGKFLKTSYNRIDFPNEYAYSKNEWLKKLLEFADEPYDVDSENIYECADKVNKYIDKPKKLFYACNTIQVYNEISNWRNEVQISRNLHKKMVVTLFDWIANSQISINKIRLPMEMYDKMLNTVLSPKHNLFELLAFQRVLRCSICYKTFFTRLLFLKHIVIDHEIDKLYACKYCDKKFLRKLTFQMHQAYHIAKNQYICNLCPKSFLTAVNLKQHVCMKQKYLRCQVCHQDFDQIKDLMTHQDTHKKITYYTCDFCPEIPFSCVADLQKHTSLSHGIPTLDWFNF